MTQYIGQITVIIDAADESIAESSFRAFAQRIEDESDAVVFADHTRHHPSRRVRPNTKGLQHQLKPTILIARS
jgi:hypothetical protein